MYTNMEKAIYFCFKAHSNQKRKNEKINFAVHPITVGMMLKEINMSEEIVISGILHDVIEDTNFKYEDIKKIFGDKIANNVRKLSENQEIKDYLERKKEFLERLKTYDNGLLMIECADKLHNLLFDYEINPQILKNHSKNMKWFYKEIYIIINIKCNNELVNRYKKVIELFEK